jgi:hypothetical protein
MFGKAGMNGWSTAGLKDDSSQERHAIICTPAPQHENHWYTQSPAMMSGRGAGVLRPVLFIIPLSHSFPILLVWCCFVANIFVLNESRFGGSFCPVISLSTSSFLAIIITGDEGLVCGNICLC